MDHQSSSPVQCSRQTEPICLWEQRHLRPIMPNQSSARTKKKYARLFLSPSYCTEDKYDESGLLGKLPPFAQYSYAFFFIRGAKREKLRKIDRVQLPLVSLILLADKNRCSFSQRELTINHWACIFSSSSSSPKLGIVVIIVISRRFPLHPATKTKQKSVESLCLSGY